MKTFLISLALSLFCLYAQSQQLELEKTYEISGKAKRGYLGGVEFNDESQEYALTYVTKSTNRRAKFETYVFDKDFNFLRMETEEIEYEKAKTRFKWFNFGGEEEQSMELLTVENNMMGQVVLKKGKFVNKYDWVNGVYWSSFDADEKVKPKDPEGRKLSMIAYTTDMPSSDISYHGWSWLWSNKTKSFSEATGDLTMVCSVISSIKDAANDNVKYQYVAMRISVDDLTIKSEETFEFDHPQSLVSQTVLPGGDFVLVFAPTGGPGMKKTADPDPLNFTYIRVDGTNATVKERISFKSLNAYWDVASITEFDNEVYLYGAANSKNNDKYFNVQSGGTKQSDFMIMKVVSGKVAYLTNTNLDEFEAKLDGPPSQKKVPAYKGKKFIVGDMEIASNGDLLIYGQNFKPKEDGVDFLDVIVFHFDDQGKLKRQYGLDVEEKNKYAKANFTESYFIESEDGSSMYWIIMEIAGARDSWGKFRAFTYPRIGKIDMNNAKVSDFMALGQEKGDKYFLENSFPILPTSGDGGQKLTFFGSDKSGKVLYFSRVILK